MVPSYRYNTLQRDTEQLNALYCKLNKETEMTHNFMQCAIGGKEIGKEDIFITPFFLKKAFSFSSSLRPFILKDICSEFFFTGFGSRLQNKLDAEWYLRSYLSSHGCRDKKSIGTARGLCHRFGCWCKKWNGTLEYPNTSASDEFLWSCYHHNKESSCLYMSVFAVLVCSVVRALSIRFFWDFNNLSSFF